MEADNAEAYARIVAGEDNATNRRTEFASMPVNINEPVCEGDHDEKNTLVSSVVNFTCINKKVESDPDKLAYCKLWLQFINSEPILAYQYWATHFTPIALRDYDEVVNNSEYTEVLAELGLNEKYYNEYHFERLRTLTSSSYSNRCYGVGNINIPINYRTQNEYFKRFYTSGVFSKGFDHTYAELRKSGVIRTFEWLMYNRETWSTLYGSTYDKNAADTIYNGVVYNAVS